MLAARDFRSRRGWVCKYKAPQGDKPLVAKRVVMLVCPECRQSHDEGAFKDGSLMCKGCGNTITLGGEE